MGKCWRAIKICPETRDSDCSLTAGSPSRVQRLGDDRWVGLAPEPSRYGRFTLYVLSVSSAHIR